MFVVSGWREGEQVREGRLLLENASELARRLVKQGHTEVKITDEEGVPLDIEAFRRMHWHSPGVLRIKAVG